MFIYLPVVLLLYYISPVRWRNPILFVANMIFYGWGEPVYILLMLVSITINYINGILIGKWRHVDDRKAKTVLVVNVVLNLALLGFFKYYNLFADTLNALPFINLPELNVTLPIGISFYTFQTMSYPIDVYRGDADVQKNYISFGTFVALFPQLIAGPIVRYKDVADQLGFPQHNPHHYLDVWHHTLAVVDAVPPLVPLRLAALLHDVAKPSCASVDAAGISHFYGHPAKGARMADAICRRLRCDGALRHRVVRLIELHDERTTPTLPAVRRLMRRTELPVLRQLFLLQRADAAGQAPATRPAKFARIAQVEALVSRVLDEGLCFTTRQLCVNGDDLAAIGVARGPQMGLFLERLLDEVVDERLENNRQALLSQAVRWLASPGENSQKSHK